MLSWISSAARPLGSNGFRLNFQPRTSARFTFHRDTLTASVSVSQVADLEYQCTDFYDVGDEIRIIWNDPTIGVKWPVAEPLLSGKDRAAAALADQLDQLPLCSGTAL